MTAKIIAVAQQKGGAGKTTMAIHLAVAMAKSGKSVAIVDIDPQASCVAWDQVRAEKFGAKVPAYPNVRGITGWRTAGEVERLARDFDIVIIDSPPHADTEAKLAIRAAHLVLIPCQPSPIDLWATKPIIDLSVMENTPTMFVLNRVNSVANITDQIRQKAAQLDTILATSCLGNRVSYVESLNEGLGVSETSGNKPAKDEINALATEIMVHLGLVTTPVAATRTRKTKAAAA